MSIVKVTDAKTRKLKRYETDGGNPIAIMSGDELVITDLGRQLGYTTSGKRLMKGKLPAF